MHDRIEAARRVAPYLWCSLYSCDADGPVISLLGLPTPEEWRQGEPLLRLYERRLALTEFEEMPVNGHA
jgi:hypothetical protein